MRIQGFFIFLCALSINIVNGQVDNVGSGHAIRFDGVDDLIDLGDNYHNINLPFSVSAWIYIDPTVNYPVPIFVSNDNDPIYRGFWFFISQNLIWCEFGDGTGGSTPSFRRGKQAAVSNVIGRWINVCAVMRGPFDISLFVNGINVGGNSMGASALTMASSFPGDHAKIGYFLSNNVTYRFKGSMDEIKLWNKALTENEVRNAMCKRLVGNESGLVGYWGFDELGGGVVNDKSPSGHHGTLQGNPVRVFSGAPIGDKSINDYKSNWSNLSMEMNEGFERILVSNLQGNPEGVHIYSVASQPSQTNGLNLSLFTKPYFGVFLATLDNNNKFDAVMLDQEGILCITNTRLDNSAASWNQVGLPVLNQFQRGEYLKIPGAVKGLNLGSDVSLCDKNDFIIDTKVVDPTISFLWSTGSTASKISVSQSGKYWVRMTSSCGVSQDTIAISFNQTPPNFSLGEDQTICPFKTTILKPYSGSSNFEFLWQDGSTNDSYQVADFGEYWVKAKNICGETSDTISFSSSFIELDSIPNVITPNDDMLNDFFILNKTPIDNISLLVLNRWGKEVFFSSNYRNDWNGDGLSAGVYFYTVRGSCIKEAKGSVSIIH
jgi:gliding motility-associated-like protein